MTYRKSALTFYDHDDKTESIEKKRNQGEEIRNEDNYPLTQRFGRGVDSYNFEVYGRRINLQMSSSSCISRTSSPQDP